jgi:hypothetical protein
MMSFSRPARASVQGAIAMGLVVAMGALLSDCGNSVPATAPMAAPKTLVYEALTPPSTVGELLGLIKTIAERRLWDRDDFYTEETFRRLFGSQQVSVTAGDNTLRVQFLGFPNLFTPSPSNNTAPSGVEIIASKHMTRPPLPEVQGAAQMWNYRTKRWFEATIWGTAQGLDFKTIVGIFGPGWRENREAENEIFMAVTREPFNPPPPQPTGYMGNAIITYTTGASTDKQEVSLRFNGEGMLAEISSATLYQDPVKAPP